MISTSSVHVIRTLGALALAAVILVPPLRGDEADPRGAFGAPTAAPSASAPIVLAQGRCFNGRCF